MKKNCAVFLSCVCISIAILFGLWSYLGRPQTLPEPSIPSDHKLECASYTPFMGHEKPSDLGVKIHIPRERLEKDFELIAQRFECVRLYFMEGLEDAPAVAQEKGLKIILSAWIGGKSTLNEREYSLLVDAARRYKSIVKFVLVGNETLLRHEQTESQMIVWVNRAKKDLSGLPVSYGEVLGFWKHYPRLADAVDFLTIHILPYWSDVPPRIDDAAKYVEWDYNQMVTQYPGKTFFVGEIGWPSEGRTRDLSAPSPVNEARFYRAVIPAMERLGWHYNIIEAFDQPWKRNNEGCVGGYWGVFDANRQSKSIFEGTVSNFPGWRVLFGCSAGVVVLLIVVVFAVGAALAAAHPAGQPLGLPLRIGVLVLAAFSLVKQGYEFYLTIFNTTGEIKAGLFLLLSFVGAVLLLFSVVSQRIPKHLSWASVNERWKTKRIFTYDALVFLYEQLVVFLLLSMSLGLVFVGRSTSILGFCFLSPVLALFYISFLRRHERSIFLQDVILSLALLIVTVSLLVNEKIWNSQANLWMGLCLLAAASLLPIFSREQLKAAIRFWKTRSFIATLLCVAIVWIGAFGVRYVLMESRLSDLDTACGNQPQLWYCRLRAWMGIGIQFKVWGMTALCLLLIGVILKRKSIAFVAFLIALAGLVWYQYFPSAAVVVLALVYLGNPLVSKNLFSRTPTGGSM